MTAEGQALLVGSPCLLVHKEILTVGFPRRGAVAPVSAGRD